MLNTVSKAGSNAVCLTGCKTVSQHKRHAKINTNPHHQFKIPTVVNRFVVLDKLKEDNSVPRCQSLKLKPTAKKLKSKVQLAKKRVTIIGDSHARGCAANLIHECGKSFEVMGNVMPGSGLLNITQAAKKEINELNRNDIVIWGVSNDISKNKSSKALKHAMKFALQHRHTIVVFVPALYRHDLVVFLDQQGNSCF
jgi:hypothetical protein